MNSSILHKEIIRNPGETTLILKGDMDFNGARDLKSELDALADEFHGEMLVTLDMKGINYVASDGLGFLISLQKRLAMGNVGLRIADPQPVVRELFSITRLDHVIPVISLDENGGE